MIITNKFNLPQPFVDMAQSDYEYKDKQYSVTTLLKPIREIMLLRRYHKQAEQDVSELIWSLFGQAVHKVLEKTNESDNLLKEFKVKTEIDGYFISGISDLIELDTQTVIDYKVTSTFKVVKKEFEDYRLQGLMYAYILKQMNIVVNNARFILVLRDWQKSKAKYDKEYPQNQVYEVNFKFTDKDFKFIEQWLKGKIAQIKTVEDLKDNELPLCTQEERWNDGDIYAVVKDGSSRATKLFNNYAEAEEFIGGKGGYSIDTRLGIDRKCEEYCAMAKFCPYITHKLPF